METRKAGVLIRFEPRSASRDDRRNRKAIAAQRVSGEVTNQPGDVLTGVGVRSSQSPPTNIVELSLTAKPQDVTLVDAGSNPVAQPKLIALGIVAVHLAFTQATGVRFSQGGPNNAGIAQ